MVYDTREKKGMMLSSCVSVEKGLVERLKWSEGIDLPSTENPNAL